MGSCISGQKRFGSSAKQSQSVEANGDGFVEEGKKRETRLSSDGLSRREQNYGIFFFLSNYFFSFYFDIDVFEILGGCSSWFQGDGCGEFWVNM